MSETVHVLQAPSGRTYRTTDEAEAQHLITTAGYKRATAYEPRAETKARTARTTSNKARTAGNKARTTKAADAAPTDAPAESADNTPAGDNADA